MPYYSELGIYTSPTSSYSGTSYVPSSPYANHSSIIASNFTTRTPPSILLKTIPRNFRPGFKPHLATISESHSPLRRINSPKLYIPKIPVSRPVTINTADIDVSFNKHNQRRYDRKIVVEEESKSTHRQATNEQKEAKPSKAIRRDRHTIRIKTIHRDVVGEPRSWRDNFGPDELNTEATDEPRAQRKTPGELLKEKFLIRSREDMFKKPKLVRRTSTKKNVARTPSFHDICQAITDTQVEELNPGQPPEIQRRQSRQYDDLTEFRKSAELEEILNELTASSELIVEEEEDESFDSRSSVRRKKKLTKKRSNEKVTIDDTDNDFVPQKTPIQRRLTQKKLRRNSSELANPPLEEKVRDISQVEIQRIKTKPKPVITATVDVDEKRSLKAIVDNVEVEESPKPKAKKAFKFNVTVQEVEVKKPVKVKKFSSQKGEGLVHMPQSKDPVVSSVVKKNLNGHMGHILTENIMKDTVKEETEEEMRSLDNPKVAKPGLIGSKSQSSLGGQNTLKKDASSDNFWAVIGPRESVVRQEPKIDKIDTTSKEETDSVDQKSISKPPIEPDIKPATKLAAAPKKLNATPPLSPLKKVAPKALPEIKPVLKEEPKQETGDATEEHPKVGPKTNSTVTLRKTVSAPKITEIKSSTPPPSSPLKKEAPVVETATPKIAEKKPNTSPPLSPFKKEAPVVETPTPKIAERKPNTSPPLSPLKKEAPVVETPTKIAEKKPNTSPTLSPLKKEAPLTKISGGVPNNAEKKPNTTPPLSPLKKEAPISRISSQAPDEKQKPLVPPIKEEVPKVTTKLDASTSTIISKPETPPLSPVKKVAPMSKITNVELEKFPPKAVDQSPEVKTPLESAKPDEPGAKLPEEQSVRTESTKKPAPSKRSIVTRANKSDPDLQIFMVPEPEPEPEPEPPQPAPETNAFVPLQSNRLSQFMNPFKKPEQFDECPIEIYARPKTIRKRHYPRPRHPVPPPVVEFPDSSEAEESDDDEEEHESSSSSTNSDEEYDVNVVYNTSKVGASTSSNDSGFDSGIPGGRNKGSSETRDSPTSNPAHNPAFALDSNEGGHEEYTQSSTFLGFQKSGRITPPATTIPRFRKYCVEDFNFLKVLGKGSFGKVLLAELRGTEYYYAIKCLKKDVVLEDDDVECTLIERKVLALGTKHPYLCHLLCTFQTESHLFFVMEYLNGGDLMFHIQQSGRFPEPRARLYGAEIVSGLKFLHGKGIVYRDLKLDNILLDFDGHVRIADFGMCKLQIFLDRTADTFCGTPDYMAPEIIKGQHYNQSVDWWSFGVLLYEMLIGQSPFSGCDEDELFWSICNEKPVIPRFLTVEANSILHLLLEKDASKRLGNRFCPSGAIQDQPFFQPIAWDLLESRQIEAPFRPNLLHPLDTKYFDRTFTAETAKLTPIDQRILQSMDQTQFQGFSYTNPNATDK